MRILLIALLGLVLIVAAAAAAALIWDEPAAPPPMPSVANALDNFDFSTLPPKQVYAARDGTKLTFLHYQGSADATAILIHGSTFTAASMHGVATALSARGARVYSLSMRGHDGTGRSGDIGYIGQLDDDLADFVATLGDKGANERRVLIGFSSGGGFVLRIAGGDKAKLFDRFVLIAPHLPPAAGVMRENAGGWVSVAVPRVLVITLLERMGINTCDGRNTVAFAISPGHLNQTPAYSCRMAVNFGASDAYANDARRAPAPIALLAGANDEIFLADRYAGALSAARPNIDITIFPGLNHMDMITKAQALNAISEKALQPR